MHVHLVDELFLSCRHRRCLLLGGHCCRVLAVQTGLRVARVLVDPLDLLLLNLLVRVAVVVQVAVSVVVA